MTYIFLFSIFFFSFFNLSCILFPDNQQVFLVGLTFDTAVISKLSDSWSLVSCLNES